MWQNTVKCRLFEIILFKLLLISSSNALECGVRKVNINKAIVRGQPTSPGDWPWHVAVHHLDYSSDSYACGGTLISEIFVLTADHCIRDNNGLAISSRRIFIRLGLHHLRDLNQQTFQQHNVYKIHKYRSPTDMLKNDIAILELSTEAEFTDNVQPACLNQEEDLTSQFGTAVGWGVDETGETSPVLKSQRMPVVSTNKCLESNDGLFRAVLDSTVICAGYLNGTTVCNGDSGGGLHFERNGVWYVGGIVSFTAPRLDSFRCHLKSYAGFTNVQTFLPWIGKVTGIGLVNGNAVKKLSEKSEDTNPTASWQWIPASNGDVPPNAVVGGYANGPLYIARARHAGEMVPGELYPPHKCCYVPWGGLEHVKRDYEVLCNANGKFVKNVNGIPENAFVSGYSKINNESLYIGRAEINSVHTLGKVSRLHGVCYVPYDGKELSFRDYEIYVSP